MNTTQERVAFTVAGAATAAITDLVLSRVLLNLNRTSKTMTGGAVLAVGSSAVGYTTNSPNAYFFSGGAIGYSAIASSYYALRTQSLQQRMSQNYDDAIIVGGEARPIETKGLFKLIDFTEDSSFDLNEQTNARNEPIKRVILHHGSTSPRALARYFKNAYNSTPKTYKSTHFGIGYDDDGSIIVAQYADTANQAWHAGWWNRGSIGIDFAISPLVNRNTYNLPVEAMDSDRIRSPSKVLRFPDELLDAAMQFLIELHRVHGLEFNMNPDKDAIVDYQSNSKSEEAFREFERSPLSEYSVLGHQNTSPSKFDVVYIWDRLLERAGVQPARQILRSKVV